MGTETTRRALLGGAGLAGVVLAAPSIAITAPLTHASRGGEVEAAFTDWKATRDELNRTEDDSTEDPNHPIWARLKRAEAIMRDSPEAGPRVAEIRLWLSLTGDLLYDAEHKALQREDADWLLANADEPEFTTIMALRAIKALRGEG